MPTYLLLYGRYTPHTDHKQKQHINTCMTWKCNEQNVRCMSQEATISEIVLDDDISDSVEHKLHIVSICCYGKLCVYVLCVSALIQPFKLLLDVCTCLLISICTYKHKINGLSVTLQHVSQHEIKCKCEIDDRNNTIIITINNLKYM